MSKVNLPANFVHAEYRYTASSVMLAEAYIITLYNLVV